MISIKEIKEAANRWYEISGKINIYNAEKAIEKCEVLEALGEEWGYKIPYNFTVCKKPYITNSSTKYKFGDDEWVVVWDNGNIGRFQFVADEYYGCVTDEWLAFLEELESYEPLDQDPCNCRKIYNIENGKRLMENYEEICKRTEEVMGEKIKIAKLEKLKREIAKLEVEEEA